MMIYFRKSGQPTQIIISKEVLIKKVRRRIERKIFDDGFLNEKKNRNFLDDFKEIIFHQTSSGIP